MKFRIVEYKNKKRELYYKIQEKFLFFWMDYRIPEVIHLCDERATVNRCAYCFDCKDIAEASLKRSMQWREYKGFSLCSTIMENVYYCDMLSYHNERMGWREYNIFGTYEECCAKIDRYFEERANKKYRKIFRIDI